ncbi:MAG: LPS-assembly protein LptD [Gammaproteobacteria bacterium]|nr:LPS-assembly protein LptD [Gammaproteobacteria bacterium]
MATNVDEPVETRKKWRVLASTGRRASPMPSVPSVCSTQAASSAASWLTRRLSPSGRWIDTVGLLMVLAGPIATGNELAELLWQDDPAPGVEPWRCPGSYVPPAFPFPRESDGATFPLVVKADRVTALETRVDASGEVEIRQGNRSLAAHASTFDETTSLARATGGVRFDEPGLSVRGAEATVDYTSLHARVEDAEFVLTDLELRGRAAWFQRDDDVVELDAATLTSCPPGNAAWQIRARSIRLDARTLLATSRHARLQLGRVPIFYAPYLRFPVSGERTSGFLAPDIYGGRDGIDISVPYYLNLAPNYDATLTPRWIAERGFGFEGEARHRARWGDTQLDAAFLPGDRDYDGGFARAGLAGGSEDPSPADRWSLQVDHRGRWGGLRTEVDFMAVSDNEYFGDFSVAQGVASRVALERRGEIEYVRGDLVARLLAQGFQRLESGPQSYRRLPDAGVAYAGTRVGPLGGAMGASWAAFESPRRDVVTGNRYHFDPRLRFALSRTWGFAEVSGGVRSTGYDLANVPNHLDPRPRRSVRVGVLDAGVFLERDVSLGTGNATQTLEPRVYYLRQSHADHDHLPAFDATELTFSYRQLFRDNRYAGLDRIGDANTLSMGVASRVLDANGGERLAARIGTMVHLDDPRVTLGPMKELAPDVVGELAGRLGRIRILSRFAWDTGADELGELGAGLSYRRDARSLVNLAYRRRFPDVDQTDLSFHWPLRGMDERLSVFGRWNHDWRNGQNIESFGGFAYATCCVAVKLLWHRTINAPRNLPDAKTTAEAGVMLEISLKGLGGFGSKVDSRLVRGIKGYRAESRATAAPRRTKRDAG